MPTTDLEMDLLEGTSFPAGGNCYFLPSTLGVAGAGW